jgi:hypothetical protein
VDVGVEVAEAVVVLPEVDVANQLCSFICKTRLRTRFSKLSYQNAKDTIGVPLSAIC